MVLFRPLSGLTAKLIYPVPVKYSSGAGSPLAIIEVMLHKIRRYALRCFKGNRHSRFYIFSSAPIQPAVISGIFAAQAGRHPGSAAINR